MGMMVAGRAGVVPARQVSVSPLLHLMSIKTDNLRYLQLNPLAWKWLNRCAACGRLGHKENLPERVGHGMGTGEIRRRFPQLVLNRVGLCSECASKAGPVV